MEEKLLKNYYDYFDLFNGTRNNLSGLNGVLL